MLKFIIQTEIRWKQMKLYLNKKILIKIKKNIIYIYGIVTLISIIALYIVNTAYIKYKFK